MCPTFCFSAFLYTSDTPVDEKAKSSYGAFYYDY